MRRIDPFELVGTTIAGKYAVEAVVDEGGFSVVYRARHLLWNRAVAIKAFKTADDLSAESRDRLLKAFIQEGAILADLSERCAAICQARDVATLTTARGEWVPYMVLEWLEGVPLEIALAEERALGAKPRGIGAAIRLLTPIADALALAHRRGIVHRDVKPGNIFLLGDPRAFACQAKLLDFGIAKVDTCGAPARESDAQSFTPSYGAPEQFTAAYGPTGPWTDVFALALTVVERVSGKEPMVGTDLHDLARQSTCPHARPTARARGADVSDAVEAVLARALEVEPTRRYHDAAELWDALRRAAQPEMDAKESARANAASFVPPPAVHTMRVVRRTGSRRAVAAAGLFAACAAIATYVLPRVAGSPAARAESFVSPAAAQETRAPRACPDGMEKLPGAAICVDAREVTTAEYRACVARGACASPPATGEWPGITAQEHAAFDAQCTLRDAERRASQAMNCVDADMAAAFCRSRGARLPSEAEWRDAARALDWKPRGAHAEWTAAAHLAHAPSANGSAAPWLKPSRRGPAKNARAPEIGFRCVVDAAR